MRWNWLHLSDLHCGMPPYSHHWPRIEQCFFEDLADLRKVTGPWDFVLFTGDLVQRGEATEFLQLDEWLGRLWSHLKEPGPRPRLIAVPGNHDLVRPATNPLADWSAQRCVPEQFWSDDACPGRKLVKDVFANYSTWWHGSQFRPKSVRDGLIPGDVSFTAEKEGARLGIVGLNSTFLQLGGDDFEGKLGLHVAQFHGACNGNGPAWAREHHVCLLLTHQPPAWLMPSARMHLEGEIAVPGQFAAHLFGHMHEPFYSSISEGGSEPRQYWQSASLFGLEHYAKGVQAMQRVHGYSAGSIRLREDQYAELTFWPRIAKRGQNRALRIVPDHSYDLIGSDHTRPRLVPMLRPLPASSVKAPKSPGAPTPPAAPATGIQVRVERSGMRNMKIDGGRDAVSVDVIESTMHDMNIKK